jgi:hypothetical protein
LSNTETQQERKDKEDKKPTQQELDNLVKPEEKRINEKGQTIQKDEVEKVKKEVLKEGKTANIEEVKSKADLLLEQYGSVIEKEKDHSKIEEEGFAKGNELEKSLGLKEYVVSDKDIQRDTVNYQKRRLAYFRLESQKEWHRIPMFEKWDEFGIAEYKLVSYRFHDYPNEVADVIDKLRGDYEDATKVRTAFEILKIFRDEAARTASARAAAAKHKWIQVGAKFILHMKDHELKKAHKDFILLVIDSSMYRQETFVPNLQIESSDTSAEDQSTPEVSPGQKSIA